MIMYRCKKSIWYLIYHGLERRKDERLRHFSSLFGVVDAPKWNFIARAKSCSAPCPIKKIIRTRRGSRFSLWFKASAQQMEEVEHLTAQAQAAARGYWNFVPSCVYLEYFWHQSYVWWQQSLVVWVFNLCWPSPLVFPSFASSFLFGLCLSTIQTRIRMWVTHSLPWTGTPSIMRTISRNSLISCMLLVRRHGVRTMHCGFKHLRPPIRWLALWAVAQRCTTAMQLVKRSCERWLQESLMALWSERANWLWDSSTISHGLRLDDLV